MIRLVSLAGLLAVGGCLPEDSGMPVRDAGGAEDGGGGILLDAGGGTDAGGGRPDAGAGEDAGEPPPDAAPPAALRCEAAGSMAVLRDAAGGEVATYEDLATCEEVLGAAGEGVVCAWFTPDMPVGPGGWNETGWRPMNWETGIGLGRLPHESYEDCLEATRNARGGVVCTNTGVGYKSAHIETNMWCGASSNLHYCLMASIAAHDFHVCSFPSEGTGAEAGWVLTRIDTECDYMTSQMPLEDCNAMIPR